MRVFDIDMQHCPNQGARERKVIAAILDRPVIMIMITAAVVALRWGVDVESKPLEEIVPPLGLDGRVER